MLTKIKENDKRRYNTMKKIPTLFERVFENQKKVGILPNVTPGMEWVLERWRTKMQDKEK